MLEHFSVAPVLATTKAEGLLHFDPNLSVARKECLPAKRILESLPNSLFFIFFSCTTREKQSSEKQKVLGRLTNNVYKIINTDTQKSKDESSSFSVPNTVFTENSLLDRITVDKKIQNWRILYPYPTSIRPIVTNL